MFKNYAITLHFPLAIQVKPLAIYDDFTMLSDNLFHKMQKNTYAFKSKKLRSYDIILRI